MEIVLQALRFRRENAFLEQTEMHRLGVGEGRRQTQVGALCWSRYSLQLLPVYSLKTLEK